MDNKNSKTFADLFSNVTSGSVEDQNEKNLEKNLDSSNSQDQVDRGMTFDRLFDRAASMQNKTLEESPFDQKEHNIDNEEVLEGQEKDSSISFGDLKNTSKDFNGDVEDSNQVNFASFSEIGAGEKELLEDGSHPFEQVESNMGGDVFLDKKNEGADKDTSEDLKKDFREDKSDEMVNLDGKLNETKEENLFLESTMEEEKSVTEKESVSGNPLFRDEAAEAVNHVEESLKVENPFLESTTEEGKSDTEKESVSGNPLFGDEIAEVVDLGGDTKKVDSPFFADSMDQKSEVQIEKVEESGEKNDFWAEPTFDGPLKESSDNLSIKKEVEEQSKSISPFFIEDDSKRDSSLELDKINLIEGNQREKKASAIDFTKSKHYDVKIVKKKEPLFKFIIGVISYAIFIWLLLIGIVLLVYVLDIKIRAAKGDYSSPTFNAYVVLTGSMLPEIQVYDVVVTKKVDAEKLEEGDVITFASADTRFLNTIITHRIIKKNYDSKTKTYSFQTRGDNNNVADSALVPQNNIYGKVILKIPKLGYLQEFLASDGGWIIVILIPCLTVISYDVVKLAKGLKKKKYKNITVQK